MADEAESINPRWRNPATLRIVALTVVTLAGGWWLLGQLGNVIRPLLIAILLSYVLLPTYVRLRRNRVPAALAITLLAGAGATALILMVLIITVSLMELTTDIEPMKEKAIGIMRSAMNWVTEHIPWIKPAGTPGDTPEMAIVELLARMGRDAASQATGGVLEAVTAGLYLLFILLGADRLPGKVRAAYSPEDAERILHEAGRINAAIVKYLKAKVLASLLLAVPVWLILFGFDVRFAMFWGVLTFLANFIPYIGSIVAYLLPTLFAFLQFNGGTSPIAVALLLLAIHGLTAWFIEPMMLGKAIGLNPLVVLSALAFWGSLWGLPGMILAVPLTAVAKLVLENIDSTRPIAKLAED